MDKNLMQSPVQVTVFIGVYNVSDYIMKTIESILAQTFTDFELLLIDDGSTDDSLEKIRLFRDPRIRIVQNDGNMGIIYTRNRGFQEAKGKYVFILDSDDMAMPDRLRIQYDYLLSHPDVKVLGGHAYRIDSKSNLINPPIAVPFGNDLKERLFFSNVFINSTVAIQKDIAKEFGYYQKPLAEDYDLFIKIAEKYAVANCDHILSKYRIHQTNISTTRADEMRATIKLIAIELQQKVGLPYNEQHIEAHCNLIQEDYKQLNIDDCMSLFIALIAQNAITQIYDDSKLNSVIAEKWFKVIRLNKTNKAISYFFHPKLFSWKYSTPKQYIKIFKQSFFSLWKKPNI